MKKLIFSLLFCAVAAVVIGTSVQASIKPTTPWSVNVPGSTSESDAYITVTSAKLDWLNQSITVTYNYGTATISGSNTTAFAKGALAPAVTVQFSLFTNQWSSSTGQSGTMSSGEISAVQSILSGSSNAIVNPAESFAISHNLFGSSATAYPYASGVTP